MRAISKIIIHGSDSPWGDFDVIDGWHKQRGWKGCGYHILILNGYRKNSRDFDPGRDGWLERGRPEAQIGSHCRGQNKDSLGICLIGKGDYTPAQYYTLRQLVDVWRQLYKVSDGMIRGHRDFQLTSGGVQKTCPNFDVAEWFMGRGAE